MTDDEILAAIRANKTPWKVYAVIALLVVAVIAAGAIAVYKHFQHESAVLASQEQLKNTQQLAAALDVSQKTATELQKKIAETQPVINYTVTAPTVQQAATDVKKQIDASTSPANKIPADKTVVTPNTEQQKVDVYRITLDKPRGVGVYVSSESAGAMLQYKNAVLFGGPKFSGGYEVGAAYLIRW